MTGKRKKSNHHDRGYPSTGSLCFNHQKINKMDDKQLSNEALGIYEKLKQKPAKSLTPKVLSKAIKQDIRCVGLVPEGMQVKGMTDLSKQEIEDIRAVSDELFNYFDGDAFSDLPPERRTEAVSQAAVNADVNHFYDVPETSRSDNLIMSALPNLGHIIDTIPEERRTLEMCLIALKTYGSALKYLPVEMITPEMVNKAIKIDGKALEFAPYEMITPQMTFSAVKQNVLALQYVPDEMKTPDMCRVALELIRNDNCNKVHHCDFPDAEVIKHVPFSEVCFEYLQKYERDNKDPFHVFAGIKPEIFTPEMAQLAARLSPSSIQFVPDHLKTQEMKDIQLVSNADIFDGVFRALPEERKTELVCLAALQADNHIFLHIPEKYRTDELILNVLRQEGALLYGVAEHRRTPEMLLTALETNGLALRHFPLDMITPEIAMKAVQLDSPALEYVPEELKSPEICRAALNSMDSKDYEVFRYVPFSDVCFDYLKKLDGGNGDPFLVFGNMKPDVITPEMAQLAVKMEPSCLQFVPDRMKTPEMCAFAVEKDWMNMRFVPENKKTKPLCEIAMNGNIHARQFVPERFITSEMYMNAVRKDGMNLQYVPEQFKTPELCLQAVMSVPAAGDFVPERFSGGYNVYEFFHDMLNDNFLFTGRLNFGQVQKIFNGETVNISGVKFAKNAPLQDFTIKYDRKTHQIKINAFNDAPEKKQSAQNERNPEKRKGIKW